MLPDDYENWHVQCSDIQFISEEWSMLTFDFISPKLFHIAGEWVGPPSWGVLGPHFTIGHGKLNRVSRSTQPLL